MFLEEIKKGEIFVVQHDEETFLFKTLKIYIFA